MEHTRFEGSTKSTLGHPEVSKDDVPQLAGDIHLGVCSLLKKEAATQKLHVKLLPQNQGRNQFFLWPVMKMKGK